MSLEFREQLFYATFERYSGTFANGTEANNKFDIEKLQDIPDLRVESVARLAMLAKGFRPDRLLSTPKGADWLTIDLGNELGLPVTLMQKNPDRTFSFYDGGEADCDTAERILLVDDAHNNLHNTSLLLKHEVLAARAVGAVALLDRGDPFKRQLLKVPTAAVVRQPVPAILSPDSHMWKYAS